VRGDAARVVAAGGSLERDRTNRRSYWNTTTRPVRDRGYRALDRSCTLGTRACRPAPRAARASGSLCSAFNPAAAAMSRSGRVVV
jgi:hypothetical protein